jgi:hypothetical protein
MPDEMRIDMTRDLSPEGLALARPLIEQMVELEARWVSTEDEVAYEQWRDVVSRLQVIVTEHHFSRAQ